MKITNIRMIKNDKEDSRVKATCSLVVEDSIVIHNIRVISGDKGLFIAMPSVKSKDGTFNDIVHPINQEARNIITDAVLHEYEIVKNN